MREIESILLYSDCKIIGRYKIMFLIEYIPSVVSYEI